ncbi:MAG: primosomal protein N' [Bacteroidota bacterium]
MGLPPGNLFCEVLLPLPLPGTFTYAIPAEFLELVIPGVRVLVKFGSSKTYSGLVKSIHNQKPELFVVKELLSVLSPIPLVNQQQFAFWDWMADYYLCHPGEVMEAAMPAVFKISNESRFCLNTSYEGDFAQISPDEMRFLDALQQKKSLTVKDAEGILNRKNVYAIIKSLSQQAIICIEEETKDKRKPKMELWFKLHPDYHQEDALVNLLDRLEKRAVRQAEVLKMFLQLREDSGMDHIRHLTLLQETPTTASVIKSMFEKGIFLKEEVEISRLPKLRSSREISTIHFSLAQEKAYLGVKEQLKQKDVVLLHGVTSSGKTELYTYLIQEYISKGKQVLYLLPEIALTTQLISRLSKYFGSKVGVYHSRLNDQERAEVYINVAGLSVAGDERYGVILGARSSLFLPYDNLGLVIVDEEHDVSYKQQNPSPRYHGRDAAIMLAYLHGAKVLLGSATPSLESYAHTESAKYGKVDLFERYGGVLLPEVQIVDMKSEVKLKRLHGFFSKTLLDKIGETLARGEQIILFQNRRGFSLLFQCKECQWSPECRNCDVTLTYHKYDGRMHCHYCGYTAAPPMKCPACGSTDIKMVGYGTEKIEEELPLYFPGVKVARLDMDSTRTKNSFERILFDFENKKIDILVGTQMVTKGLDFDHVQLVGIMNADSLMSFPDFRAHERGYQLMAQVSGRSGRKQKQGKVLIQTWNPTHPLIKKVKENNYFGFYQTEIADRKVFDYPPYSRLIILNLKHRDVNIVKDASALLASELRKELGKRVLGPEFPIIARIQNQYIRQIMIKFGRELTPSNVKSVVKKCIDLMLEDPRYRYVRVIMDVDPY